MGAAKRLPIQNFLLSSREPLAFPVEMARPQKTSRVTRQGEPLAAVSDAVLAAAFRAQSKPVLIAHAKAGSAGFVIDFVNASFCALTGYAARELVGQSVAKLHEDAAELARLREGCVGGTSLRPLVGQGFLILRGGGKLAARWTYEVFGELGASQPQVVATYRDQTETAALREDLARAQQIEAVGRLAGNVAHDFNNLISVITGYSEMLTARLVNEPAALVEVAAIQQTSAKAAALVQQLLIFSRRQSVDLCTVNINTLIRREWAVLQQLVRAEGSVELDLAEVLPNVRTGLAQFQQVLLNLVLNARDALRAKGRIVIGTTVRELARALEPSPAAPAAGRYVVLMVTDNGTGIDAATRRRLFEPFFTTKPAGKGTGLGLPIVHELVRQSGGFVKVRSTVLVGSTFEVWLPATDAAAEESPPLAVVVSPARGHESVGLIEADGLVRKMVAGMLTVEGYRVSAAATWAEGLGKPDAGRPLQLLITSLAGEGEREVERFFKACPQLRVLCTCESEESQGTVRWLKAEHQARIIKPYALSDLLRAVRKLLDVGSPR